MVAAYTNLFVIIHEGLKTDKQMLNKFPLERSFLLFIFVFDIYFIIYIYLFIYLFFYY